MQTTESNRQADPGAMSAEEASGIKQRLGNIGRRIKHVDLRAQITAHPFAAIGIAAGVGAIVGLARPMPQRGRISSAVMAMIGALGLRLMREAAIAQIGQYAKEMLDERRRRHGSEDVQAQAPQAGTGAAY